MATALSPELEQRLMREAVGKLEDISTDPDYLLAETEDVKILYIDRMREEFIAYLAKQYFGTSIKCAKTRRIEKKLKEVFEQTAQQLGYERKRLSLDWRAKTLKVKTILEPTLGRDNEYFSTSRAR